MSKKILIVGPAWVGDMVMAQCLFKLLKQQQPDVIIDVLAPAWSLPLLARMPEVSSAIVMPLGHGQLDLRVRYQLGKALRVKQYDQGIVLPNSYKSALILWWAKIPVRTGWTGEMRYFILNDRRILDKKRYPLMIERFMALGLSARDTLPKEYPSPELNISTESQKMTLAKYGLSGSIIPILALCPGAEFGSAKRWPPEYYAEIAKAKLEADWQVWIFGSQKDQSVADQIMKSTQHQCVNLTGRTSLEEAIDLLSLATAVVSNDSGLMHIAAALRKPLVAVYGPTSPTFTPPLSESARVLSTSVDCQPCFQRICPMEHHRCMIELKPERILTAVKEVISA
ncbi:MAG: lipopolysaccharide heptosyltransferase II [Gammaproteobacteria bacterium]|nr:lipopolysaccharide heptosyltransferase II [Gammaproteobacteria bacterium]